MTDRGIPDKPSIQRHGASQRVLACISCQNRKVKCDRQFPCLNCQKAGVDCIPATLGHRPRRRRFAERELLDRVRHYESLLRHNGIEFEPLHPERDTQLLDTSCKQPFPGSIPRSSASHSAGPSVDSKNIWHALSQKEVDHSDNSDVSDHIQEVTIRRAWSNYHGSDFNESILFGPSGPTVDVAALHPSQLQIIQLWQVYIENVNPLLRVVHVPTMQSRIIHAAGNLTGIKADMMALMYGIYSVGALSLTEDHCHSMMGVSKTQLLARYQSCCKQALFNSKFLQSSDYDCLTALYLYLVSARPQVDPRSISSMLGIAFRIAQRMAIHSESSNAKFPTLEAEQRRRLWWSLVLFDSRVSEQSDNRTSMLIPTWDCRGPLNVNDSDLQENVRSAPPAQARPTEAIFVVVRSQIGDVIRRSSLHLEFTSPMLRDVRKKSPSGGEELEVLEKSIEQDYLQFCSTDNGLHLMTTWTARGTLARSRLYEHYSRVLSSSEQQDELQLETAMSHALTMIEYDTNVVTSPLTKGYLWFINAHFPLLAHIHIFQDLKKRPLGQQAQRAWNSANGNYEARFVSLEMDDHLFSTILARTIVHAWTLRKQKLAQSEDSLDTPQIVYFMRQRIHGPAQETPSTDADYLSAMYGSDVDVSMFLDAYAPGLGGMDFAA